MGCCISKCSTEEDNQLNHVNVQLQDKLVISPPTPTLIYSSNKISPSPPSPTSSITSFTYSTSNTTLSSLSCASSATLTSKDRSFSNEFLLSCYKDNPHITRINSLTDASLSFMPTTKPKPQSIKLINPSPPKPNFTPSFSMPQKRVRSNSPTNLTRQKSFRKEPVRSITINSTSNVPSRRFNGDNGLSKRVINSPKVNVASSNNRSRQLHDCGLRHRDTFRVDSKIDDTLVDSTVIEDIDNPLISLDCFIFL